jgi:hypothetical protein
VIAVPKDLAATTLRLIFAIEFPSPNGDNCLLTPCSAFVDLAFSRLLAYGSGVAALLSTATN